MDRRLKEAKELLLKEIEPLVKKGSLSATELENLKGAIQSIHYIYEICKIDMELGEESGEEYSERGYSMWGPNHDRYYDIHAYRDDGNSYRRNSMGRYSRTDAKEHMINGLYSMKDDASNEADRGAIQECINKLRA